MASIEIKDLEKQKKQLKASYDMWEKTISETTQRMKAARQEDKTKKYTQEDIDKQVELLKNGQQDIIDKWLFLGGTLDELKGSPVKSSKPVVRKKKQDAGTVFEQLDNLDKEEKKTEVKPISTPTGKTNSSIIPKMDESNPLASYDIIPLPSKGECYKDKQDRIAVSYLTAMDENVIVSPNLYRNNMVLDVILKEKIRNSDIDPDDLLDGDRDAIILFLRTSAYGNMYSVTTTDPETKKQFDTQIDLSQLKYKDFDLVGDENGYFDYQLPVSKDNVKFKFLTHGDYANLNKLEALELPRIRKDEIEKASLKLNAYLDEDETLSKTERLDVSNALKTLSVWANKCGEESIEFSHRASNELEMEIVSVNGNTDRKFIHDYVANMPIKDSLSLRRYITQNTPGVDYNFELEKPESLGGGSMKVFLQFDQFIFLADTE